MTSGRIQKIISSAGICSRRQAEKLLLDKRIKVNGAIANLGDQANLNFDHIVIDDLPISPLKTSPRVYLLNKPSGYLSSCSDPYGRPTVLNLLPKTYRKGIYPVGRLDLQSTGALILTNLGELALRLTHPRYAHTKTYQVLIKGNLSSAQLSKWRNGLSLDGKLTKPAEIEIIKSQRDQTLLKVILSEGRNRQIRRVVEKLGSFVIELKRVSISNFSLDGLPEGAWRTIEKNEWTQILK